MFRTAEEQWGEAGRLFVFNRRPGSFADGTIPGIENAIHYVSIVVGFARLQAPAHTFHEMLHLALVSVREGFFGKGRGPAEIDVRLFDHITSRFGGERG